MAPIGDGSQMPDRPARMSDLTGLLERCETIGRRLNLLARAFDRHAHSVDPRRAGGVVSPARTGGPEDPPQARVASAPGDLARFREALEGWE